MRDRDGLRLVGAHEIDAPDGDERITATLFDRLPREVRHAGELTRFVAFDTTTAEGSRLHFLGIEVDRIEEVPAGLEAWELEETARTVRSVLEPPRREGISWDWLDKGRDGNGRWVGGFRQTGGEAGFVMCANAYLRPGAPSPPDEVVLLPYEEAWIERFHDMEAWLRRRLGPDLALRIEHYGSTSIPGMPAKPVVDILVEVPSFEEARRGILPRLNDETWEYWWYSGHMVFIKRTSALGPRTHHVHVAPRGHEVWKGLELRDYLRSHSADAARYAELKRRLAESFRSDRERYTREKADFVREIAARASGA